MSQSPARSSPGAGPTNLCPTCGGRGALRMGDESCRTCLDCLGQGRVPRLTAATTTAEVLNQGALLQPKPIRIEAVTPVRDASTFAAR